MAIYSFNPFGYEGSLVTVECDIRTGEFPAVDIIGLADNAVGESRERMRAAIKSSGFEFPSERVLMSLSPADMRKEGGGFDLAMCLAVLAAKDDYPRSQDANVLVMGEVELCGSLRSCRAIYPALCEAAKAGIKYAIIPEGSETAIPNGIRAERCESLRGAYEALARIDEGNVYGGEPCPEPRREETKVTVCFDGTDKDGSALDSLKEMNGLKFAMAVAAAGGHHLMAWGKPGCGKTVALTHFPELLPYLTDVESESSTRIHSVAGLLRPNEGLMKVRPFRMPHQTVSIEGMCGGGAHCRPGEVSLAHNGVLFLDDAAEFRASVLQMLRVPLETGAITLSRAGRTTTYPANFQLVMAANPCPCGNYGNPDKVCLCSRESVQWYWKKFSAPLIDRIAIRFDCNAEHERSELNADWSLSGLRTMIERARRRQHERQGKLNQDLEPIYVLEHFKPNPTAKKALVKWVSENASSQRAVANVLRLAQTIADMDGSEDIELTEIEIAMELHGKPPVDIDSD